MRLSTIAALAVGAMALAACGRKQSLYLESGKAETPSGPAPATALAPAMAQAPIAAQKPVKSPKPPAGTATGAAPAQGAAASGPA